MEHPMIFVSYSHDSDEHKAWVLELASHLRSHGVDAILDQWDLQIGSDIRFYMEDGLSSAKLVLCICSEEYVKKVDSGIGGAGYEGMLMTQTLLQNAKDEFVIPVIRNNSSRKKTPTALGSKLYIDFSDDSQYFTRYRELLERIYGEDTKRKPPLGVNPLGDQVGQQIETKTKVESIQYHSPAMDGSVTFRYDNNNGVFILGDGEYRFETHWSRSGNDSIHAYGLIGFKANITDFPLLEQIIDLDFSSHTRTIRTGQVVVFENVKHHFAAVKVGVVRSSGHGYQYDEMVFDYHIYSSI